MDDTSPHQYSIAISFGLPRDREVLCEEPRTGKFILVPYWTVGCTGPVRYCNLHLPLSRLWRFSAKNPARPEDLPRPSSEEPANGSALFAACPYLDLAYAIGKSPSLDRRPQADNPAESSVAHDTSQREGSFGVIFEASLSRLNLSTNSTNSLPPDLAWRPGALGLQDVVILHSNLLLDKLFPVPG